MIDTAVVDKLLEILRRPGAPAVRVVFRAWTSFVLGAMESDPSTLNR